MLVWMPWILRSGDLPARGIELETFTNLKFNFSGYIKVFLAPCIISFFSIEFYHREVVNLILQL